jgi:TolB protein
MRQRIVVLGSFSILLILFMLLIIRNQTLVKEINANTNNKSIISGQTQIVTSELVNNRIIPSITFTGIELSTKKPTLTIEQIKTKISTINLKKHQLIAFTGFVGSKFTGAKSYIFITDQNGSQFIQLTTGNGDDRSPSWSPDGSEICFVSNRDGNTEIYKIKIDGTGLTRLTNNPSDNLYPSWSPDGAHIAFSSNRNQDNKTMDLYMMNSDGTNQKRITNNEGTQKYFTDPDWSPDGNKLAFTGIDNNLKASDDEQYHNIYVINLNNNKIVRLTGGNLRMNSSVHKIEPAWSPDGSKIAYTWQSFDKGPGYYSIYIMSSDALENRHVAEGSNPSWSPDGKTITYESFYTEECAHDYLECMQIMLVNSDGTTERLLPNEEGMFGMEPKWQR